jgi:hypothetical protein
MLREIFPTSDISGKNRLLLRYCLDPRGTLFQVSKSTITGNTDFEILTFRHRSTPSHSKCIYLSTNSPKKPTSTRSRTSTTSFSLSTRSTITRTTKLPPIPFLNLSHISLPSPPTPKWQTQPAIPSTPASKTKEVPFSAPGKGSHLFPILLPAPEVKLTSPSHQDTSRRPCHRCHARCVDLRHHVSPGLLLRATWRALWEG